jgi:hypothetical protein
MKEMLPLQYDEMPRKVKFNKFVLVRTVDHINDLSDEEICNSWYQKAEYRRIRACSVATVRKISYGTYHSDTDHSCSRGLEARTTLGLQIRKNHKLETLVAVLDEQERQRIENIRDDSVLAQASIEATASAISEARLRGLLDANEATYILNERLILNVDIKSCIDAKEQREKKVLGASNARVARSAFNKKSIKV